jgi:hypothetical protein
MLKNLKLEKYYVDQYVKMHKENLFEHGGYHANIGFIAQLVKEHDAKTMLDYGSGDGKQYTESLYHKAWGFMPTLYDPAIDGISELPEGQFDCVVCTDVLEHIPIDNVFPTLVECFNKSRKFVYFAISTEFASKRLPNGENCHITVKTADWWKNMIHVAYDKSNHNDPMYATAVFVSKPEVYSVEARKFFRRTHASTDN